MKNYPSICIIGAGISGITMMKALGDRGIPYTAFDKSDQLGGNWVFRNKNGMSSAYRSLHIDSSRYSIEFDDFPFPKDYPDFPHHTQILAYFKAYAEHFGVTENIRFNTGVRRAERTADGTWRITLEDGEVHNFDLLVVANGHHWDARWPEPPFPGRFDGIEMHSHDYIDAFTPHDLHGKFVWPRIASQSGRRFPGGSRPTGFSLERSPKIAKIGRIKSGSTGPGAGRKLTSDEQAAARSTEPATPAR